MTEIQKYLAEEVADDLAEADHAFFNDTGARFNPHAAAEAWHRALNWFDDAGDHDHH